MHKSKFFVHKEGKNDRFEKTQSDLESYFYHLFDGHFKFEELSLFKQLFQKNSWKKGYKSIFLPIFGVKMNVIQKTVSHLERYFLDLSDAVFRMKKFVLVHALLMKN